MAKIREGRQAGLRLRAYALLSRALVPKSYLGEVLLAAFAGTHIPLLALYVLLAPSSAASIALRAYLERGALPDLATDIDDEGGRLLGDVQGTIVRLDGVIGSLHELSREDALTGAHNRRAREERPVDEVAGAERGGEALALAAVDLDNLKEKNDRRGPTSCDAALRHPAATIGHNIRESDWLARWGGDEFVVAFWDAGSPPRGGGATRTCRGRPPTEPGAAAAGWAGTRQRGRWDGPVQGRGKRAGTVREGGYGLARGETARPKQDRPCHVKIVRHRPGTRGRGARPEAEPGYDGSLGPAREAGDPRY